ncbi:hypothetical protein FOA52_010528 [Chlamydomonas sp. UWO 241]|nr:hypothetical protein FOA52_010528 [Chlamydomonas sp. UWO 241]
MRWQLDAAAATVGSDLYGLGTFADGGGSDEEGSEAAFGGLTRVPGCSGPDDPLATLNLSAHLRSTFLALRDTDPQLLQAAGAEMSARQAKAVQALFGAAAPQ